MDNYKEIFENKMRGESKKLVDAFLLIPEDNITDIKRDAVLYDINGNEVSTVFLGDYLLNCHKSPKLFSLEILTNGNEPVYSYYQTMRGNRNTIFQTGYVRIKDGEIADAGVQNTIYPNKVVEKYFKDYWKFDKNAKDGFYTCFHDFSKKLFDEKDISPSYYYGAESHPEFADAELVFVNDNGVVDGIYTDVNRKAENYKENICLLNDMMNRRANLIKITTLMDGSSEFRFDGVADSVTNIENTDFKKFDLHY
ncbi:MAG: hypothetical protein IJ193_03070 [Bacilli bacterium]|nr:hypothetical protein [Bacilli bacterium]